jgi:hypothetical protein
MALSDLTRMARRAPLVVETKADKGQHTYTTIRDDLMTMV